MVKRLLLPVAIGASLSACQCNVKPIAPVGGALPMPVAGAQTWTIDGKTYDIEATTILSFSGTEHQYTVVWRCPSCQDPITKGGEASAEELAAPIFGYVEQKQLYKKTGMKDLLRGGDIAVQDVGVEIRFSDNPPNGFRVSRAAGAVASPAATP